MINRRLIISTGVVTAASALLASPADAATRPTLRRGDSGSAVVTLQKRLHTLGYWCGAADGDFDWLTQQAVMAIQKVAGLTRSGVCGSGTWAALDKGTRPGARYGGTHIEIHKYRQILKVVVDGRVHRIANTSTGGGYTYYQDGVAHKAVTPSGSFKVWWRYTSGWQNGTLGMMYKPAYFNRGIAIHGSTSVPSYPASHGCCRVTPSFMNYLYSKYWVQVGDRVIVY